ncbi:hypothetical protein [Helicobacter didelphidarum]|nr:hypothetical protein [Helicobacter didelphidarum]
MTNIVKWIATPLNEAHNNELLDSQSVCHHDTTHRIHPQYLEK